MKVGSQSPANRLQSSSLHKGQAQKQLVVKGISNRPSQPGLPSVGNVQKNPGFPRKEPAPNTNFQQMMVQQQDTQRQKQKPSNVEPEREPEKTETTWPIFKLNSETTIKKFWDKKTSQDLERVWFKKNDGLPFQGSLMRIGKKKKSPKGYFYRLRSDGVLMYFKKESDSVPKGYLKLDISIRCTIIQQKTKRSSVVPVIFLERTHGTGITIFDHLIERTMLCFDAIKEFALVRGFDTFYTQLDLLGKGSFASVYKVQKLDDAKFYAAKTYFKETFESSQHKDKFFQMVHNEVQVLRSVRHNSIVRLFEIIQDRDKLVLIMEYVPGGDLYSMVKKRKRVGERICAHILKGVADALFELHRHEYVHRDLKLENIMIESKETYLVKLVDFGFAERINYKELVSKAGTPGYIPPEIFKNQPYTSKGDIFSMGVIIYSMITGDSPFKAKNYQLILEENKRCNIDFAKPVWNEISFECKTLLKKMCEVKPDQRASSLDILESPWIVHNTKQSSEITYYQSFSKGVSGLEYGDKGGRSVKSVKKGNNSDSEKSSSNNDFQNDFSYYSNELKSFYKKNSMKTIHSQKSNISNISNNQKPKPAPKPVTPQQHSRSHTRGYITDHQKQDDRQAMKKKSQSLKASVRFKQVQEVDSEQSKEREGLGYINQGSFGEKQSQFSKTPTTNSLGICQDFTAISYSNLLFLKFSHQTFNQIKIPSRGREKQTQKKPDTPHTMTHIQESPKYSSGKG